MFQRHIVVIAVLLAGVMPVTPLWASNLHYVEQLIKKEDYTSAYEVLTTTEDHHLGEPEYDFMLGRTAIETGHIHEATFAFERVLLNQPNNDRARVELALAYFLSGEDETSKELFLQVLKNDPPGPVKDKINKFLGLIERRIDSRHHQLSAYIELRQGHSSNINSATSNTHVEIFGFSFPLSASGRAIADDFTQLDTGVNYIFKKHQNLAYFSAMSFNSQENNTEKFDTETGNVQIGAIINSPIGRIRIPVQTQFVRLDSVTYQRATSISTDLSHKHTGFASNYFIQHSQIRYPTSSALDVDSTTMGIGLNTLSKGSRNYQFTLFHGQESALKSVYDYNAKTVSGLQAGMNWYLNRNHKIQPKLLYQTVAYNKRHPFFTPVREDDYTLLALKWVWQMSRSWSLNSNIQSAENDSNLTLYQYEQNQVFIGIRYDID